MGQWSCKCGQRMTDHTYPDKNAFLVFSQELWEEISGMTDENCMINLRMSHCRLTICIDALLAVAL